MDKNKHIHFIGICGVAMSALAIAFHKNGWKVTGSDKGFYPPVSTHLKNTNINFYPGWHPKKMAKDGDPDLVVVGNVAGSSNPEWKYVKENDIEYKSYPKLVSDYLICDNSIVCAGTYGKTSSTTLLSWILKQSDLSPNYMFGGLAVNDELPAAEVNKENNWSVVEGDEYKTSRWDTRPKFNHYSPTHLLLTSVVWDHADLYPTEKKYIEVFEKLVNNVPEDGLSVLSQQAAKALDRDQSRFTTYGKDEKNNYRYKNLKQTKEGVSFEIKTKSKSYNIKSRMIGEYMAENITGCFAIAREIGIKTENIISAINSFKGIKRRLEKRYQGKVDVYDDIAHSPEKARSVLKTVSKLYEGKVIAVFEPNTGNRKKKSIPSYKNAFKGADEVVVPRLSKVKKRENDPDPPFDGEKLKEVVSKTHNKVKYIEDDFELVDHLINSSTKDGTIVFLGSHGFRRMIEMTVNALN